MSEQSLWFLNRISLDLMIGITGELLHFMAILRGFANVQEAEDLWVDSGFGVETMLDFGVVTAVSAVPAETAAAAAAAEVATVGDEETGWNAHELSVMASTEYLLSGKWRFCCCMIFSSTKVDELLNTDEVSELNELLADDWRSFRTAGIVRENGLGTGLEKVGDS